MDDSTGELDNISEKNRNGGKGPCLRARQVTVEYPAAVKFEA
jgi:hypothetical protein